jgi:hypothetical protein
MHTPPQADLHLLELGLHALANRLPKHQEPSLLRLPADVRESAVRPGFCGAYSGVLEPSQDDIPNLSVGLNWNSITRRTAAELSRISSEIVRVVSEWIGQYSFS